MAKFFVSASTLPLLLCTKTALTHRCASVVSSLPTATSRFQFPNKRSIGTNGSVSSFSVRRFASSSAGSGGNLGSTAVPTSVPVREAHELLLAGYRYLDVRTPEEFSAGHPIGATNVPFWLRVRSGMTKNPKFLEEVLSQFEQDDDIVVGCQIGKRSFMAATELVSSGFTGIIDVAGGYDAWTQNGLPTE